MPSLNVLTILTVIVLHHVNGEIIKNFLESVRKDCAKERVTDERYYIVKVRQFYVLRRCRGNRLYSPLLCGCVPRADPSSSFPRERFAPAGIAGPRSSPDSLRRIKNSVFRNQIKRPVFKTTLRPIFEMARPLTLTLPNERNSRKTSLSPPAPQLRPPDLIPVSQQSDFTTSTPIVFSTSDPDKFCNPYFKFRFDKSFQSSNNSISSQPSKTIKFVPVEGSSGSTAALFQGEGAITVWSMSFITFANKIKFYVRFKLKEGYKYRNRFYNLISDGPCQSKKSKYSISVNPIRKEIRALFMLRNKDQLDMALKKVNLDNWVEVTLAAQNGDVMLSTQNKEVMGFMGASTVKASPCPLEIGKKSPKGENFVGYIDIIQFHNCFGNG